jgi:hypothetical protein
MLDECARPIFRNLQTLDITTTFKSSLFENNYCLRCTPEDAPENGITETNDHIWECTETKKLSHQIYNRTTELIHSTLQNELTNRETINNAISHFRITPQTILSDPLCRGLITTASTRKAKNLKKILIGFKPEWIITFAAAMTRAMFEIIWNPRTAQIIRIRKELQKQADLEEKGRQDALRLQATTRRNERNNHEERDINTNRSRKRRKTNHIPQTQENSTKNNRKRPAPETSQTNNNKKPKILIPKKKIPMQTINENKRNQSNQTSYKYPKIRLKQKFFLEQRLSPNLQDSPNITRPSKKRKSGNNPTNHQSLNNYSPSPPL